MEKTNKRKAKAVALATAVVLVLAGTIAYLADASGTIRNVFDNEHIRVQINESGVDKDNGDKNYTVLPGTSEDKDPTITVDTDTDTYVFAVVKDTINSHTQGGDTEPTRFVNYSIADGWTLLAEGGPGNGLSKKTIDKYIDILNNKTTGELEVDPTNTNTKIYYRVVHGAESADHSGADHRFTFNVLTNDQISYPTTLTNEDMAYLNTIAEAENKALIFQTYAVQMEPFCTATETDTAKLAAGAKDAWNQVEKVSRITVTAADDATEVGVGKTLQMSATVLPEDAEDKTVTWSVVNGTGEATIDSNGVLTGGTAGTVTVVATANDGSGVKGTYKVTVTVKPHNILWQVQLHSYDSDTNTATFWPAMTAPANYGPHEHDGDCICNATWEDIAANPSAYSACITAGCTKTVTIDANSNPEIFDISAFGEGTELKSGMLYSSLKSDARKWDKNRSSNPDTASYKDTLPAMKNASDVKDVAGNFDLLSLDDAHSVSESSRIVYNESGGAARWWLATPFDRSAYCVNDNGIISVSSSVDTDACGIAPGFSISKNN